MFSAKINSFTSMIIYIKAHQIEIHLELIAFTLRTCGGFQEDTQVEALNNRQLLVANCKLIVFHLFADYAKFNLTFQLLLSKKKTIEKCQLQQQPLQQQ